MFRSGPAFSSTVGPWWKAKPQMRTPVGRSLFRSTEPGSFSQVFEEIRWMQLTEQLSPSSPCLYILSRRGEPGPAAFSTILPKNASCFYSTAVEHWNLMIRYRCDAFLAAGFFNSEFRSPVPCSRDGDRIIACQVCVSYKHIDAELFIKYCQNFATCLICA
jgi:hypothetical protein